MLARHASLGGGPDAPESASEPPLARAATMPVDKLRSGAHAVKAAVRMSRLAFSEWPLDRSVPHDSLPGVVRSQLESVILLEVTVCSPRYLRPWEFERQHKSSGSGFVIDGGRILTNFHVVENAVDIRLRRHGLSARWPARVVCAAQDVDLALVELAECAEDAAAFWDGLAPIRWGRELPCLQSSVNVVGYPTGGRTVCITEGVVSRIDAKSYRLGMCSAAMSGRMLVIQIDAAINPGNSGGPCFDGNGDVVGVAFQGMNPGTAQNVGYIIPVPVALNFLRNVAAAGGRRYTGVTEVPYRLHPLLNRSLRSYHKLPAGATGVVLTDVSPLAAAAARADDASADFLEVNDVIMRIDGLAVGDDYTCELRERELVTADYLVTCKPVGEPTCFEVLRNGEPRTIVAVLGPLQPPMPRTHGFDCAPSWLVIGGLLFAPLTCPMLDLCSQDELYATGFGPVSNEVFDYMASFRKETSTERVVLIDIMAAEINYGYRFSSWRLLERVNGAEVPNMPALYAMWRSAADAPAESRPAYITFEFKGSASPIVLGTQAREHAANHGMFKAQITTRTHRLARILHERSYDRCAGLHRLGGERARRQRHTRTLPTPHRSHCRPRAVNPPAPGKLGALTDPGAPTDLQRLRRHSVISASYR